MIKIYNEDFTKEITEEVVDENRHLKNGYTTMAEYNGEKVLVFHKFTEQNFENIYAGRVEQLIRKKYTLSAELAILRQRDSKPDEFAEYNAFAEECKATAKSALPQVAKD